MHKRGQMQSSGFLISKPERAQELNKKAVLDMSFGMIFSIIIIIVTVAVAFYVIKEFMVTSSCAEIQAFHVDLQREIDTVWRSAAAQVQYKESLPASVKSVCFGKPEDFDTKRHAAESMAFQSYRGTAKNFFIYPVQCGAKVSVREITHVSLREGFCVPVVKGEIQLKLSKTSSTSSEVTLTP